MKILKSKTSKKSLKAPQPLAFFNKNVVAAFAIIFAVIGTLLIIQTNAAPKSQPAVTLSLSPSSASVQAGETLSIAVKLNTNGQAVNAVQATVTYPTDKFEFVGVDATGSAFSVEAPVDSSAGLVTIPRGSTTSITSTDALVATLRLRAISAGRKIQVRLADSSLVLRTIDNVNILARRLGGQYTIR